MKSLFCFFRRVCFIALLLISLTSPQATFANDLIVPHGTLASQLGAPSYQLSTDWQGFNVLGIAVQVNLGGDIGGTAANVSMSGSGHLQYSQYPGNANLTFSGGAGTATMDIGFETWAKYRIAFAGFHGEGNLPLLPDIANTDLRFADQQPFNSYMLGSTVTLSDTVDDVQIVSVPAIDSVEFDLPPGLFDISIGISITPSLTCKLKGTRLDTGEGFFYSPGDALNVYLNAPSLTVSDIVQTTHCDFIAGIMPNGTIEVTAFGLWDHTGTLPTGLNISLPIASADISTTPSQNVTFNLQTSAPVITTVSPATLLTSGSPQPIKIIGSGFTGSSTLLFNGSIASDPARLTYINANEIDYNVIVPSAGNWTVQVVNGAQTSNSKSFTVNAPTANTGSLVVNLSPVGATSAGAQWQVNGIFHNSGDVVPSLAPGQYTVTFKSVSGYTTPASQQVTVTANAQATVNASYSTILPSTYSLTLNYNNTQGGASASPLAAGNAYTAGAVVQLYASPSFGYHFTGWSGDASGTANPLTITMNGSKNITANFASGDPNLGTITVTIQPPGAATAGVTWGFNANDFRNSGTSYTGYPETVILTLHTVDGWIGPPVLFATFTAGQTTNYNVTFTADTTPGLLTVTLSPPDAVTAGAKWHVNDGAAQGNGATVPLAPGNGYNITFDAVSGWTAPTTQSVQVQRGQTTVVTGNYGPPTGQPLIGEISPPIGPMTGGTLLSLNGVNFTSPATVTIGGQQASNVTISSSSQITCVTPPNSLYGSSPVVVHTPTGNATNLNGFAYGASLGSKIDLVSSIGGRNYAVAVQGNYAFRRWQDRDSSKSLRQVTHHR